MKLELVREKYGGKQVTGMIYAVENEDILFSCHSLELPDLHNHPGTSCIPKGTYKIQKCAGSTTIHHEHFTVMKVPGRSGVKIHRGNYYTQIRGCILPGLGLSDINGDGYVDVTNSKGALDKLLKLCPQSLFLTIY